MQEKIELKPCPFCGGIPYLSKWESYPGNVDIYEIICSHCKSRSSNSLEKEIIELWNKRIPIHIKLPKDLPAGTTIEIKAGEEGCIIE